MVGLLAYFRILSLDNIVPELISAGFHLLPDFQESSQVIKAIRVKAKVLTRLFKRVNGLSFLTGVETMLDTGRVKLANIEFIPVMSQ